MTTANFTQQEIEEGKAAWKAAGLPFEDQLRGLLLAYRHGDERVPARQREFNDALLRARQALMDLEFIRTGNQPQRLAEALYEAITKDLSDRIRQN